MRGTLLQIYKFKVQIAKSKILRFKLQLYDEFKVYGCKKAP